MMDTYDTARVVIVTKGSRGEIKGKQVLEAREQRDEVVVRITGQTIVDYFQDLDAVIAGKEGMEAGRVG